MKKKGIKRIGSKNCKLHLKPLFDDTELSEIANYDNKNIEELTAEDKKEINKLIDSIIN